MKRILVVGHDLRLMRLLKRDLTQRGFQVTLASSERTALARMHSSKPDLVVIDMALPDIDAIEVCLRLRQAGDKMLPILLVSPSESVADKVIALDSGADDYLTRPFDFEEFAARIRAGLRRVENTPARPAKIAVGDLVLDTMTKQVWRSDEPVSLTIREYELLELLALNAGRVLSKGWIFEQVWGCDSEAGWEVIKVYVNYVRAKLNTRGKPDLVHAVRGVGYTLRP
jgi:DNA-binding response OmpR family regulator